MNMFKIAMVSAAALGVALGGATANAEPVRAAAATPGVVSIKNLKVLRTTAPSKRESREVSGTYVGLAFLGGGAAGFGLYEATKSSDSNGG
jgi:hypothetical protein